RMGCMQRHGSARMEVDIMQKVKSYLIDHVGDMTAPGTPVFDATLDRWRVPILCKTEKGILLIGEVLTNSAGKVLFAPSKEEMLVILHDQVCRLPCLVFSSRDGLAY